MAIRRVLRSVVGALLVAAGVSSTAVAAPAGDPGRPATADAVSVSDFLADRADDTAAFEAAMDAALQSSTRFADGPGGQPQAVVFVGPGRYRLNGLEFRDDIRLEVDAGAVLQQPADVDRLDRIALIRWDAPSDGPPLHNVSIVAVGKATNKSKDLAAPLPSGWNVARSFTIDLDPARTGGSSFVKAIELEHVDGFLIDHLLTLQNDTIPEDPSRPIAEWWPTTSRAAIVFRADPGSPVGGPFFDPHHGRVVHHINVGAPRGFGANQVNSAHDVDFQRIYSRGGTALRLESDDARGRFGSEISGLTATSVYGDRCNRAVSFAPHEQWNDDVAVTDVTARGCYQGVVESADEGLPADRRGGFEDSHVTDVEVIAGDGAQIPTDAGGWRVGPSFQAFGRDAKARWWVRHTDISCVGPFTAQSATILTDDGMQRPRCASE